MKIIAAKSLAIPEIKVVRFGRFSDQRGYFTEPYRSSDLHENPMTDFLHNVTFLQQNESYSVSGVVRGLHFQWNPHMGKFVRTVRGHMIDLVLDIRKGSPTVGKIIAYDMPDSLDADYSEWIWVPPGFAHGNFFTEPSTIEYFCSAEYSPTTESGISPVAPDIDWSLCDPGLKGKFDALISIAPNMSDKDRDGQTLADWLADERSEHYQYE
ncbi:uncharacterized protein METZ01_LOCUS185413 [marine metagenome]|uniref:dTDP-4-dehydrorhamnose 3,5-epimerase n=1 Tax=marine metagenome TaxID=408172 RepID=A0A382D376_9ZZZZ